MCGFTETERYFLSDEQQAKITLHIDADKIIDQVIANVYEGTNNTQQQDRAMINEQYSQLREGIKEGYGKLSVEVQFGTPNHEMLKNLQTNVGVFSAFKKHDMLKEMVKALKTADGKLKPKAEFVTDAQAIAGKYRKQNLEREYDTAVRSSRMATVWAQIDRTRRLYPNIKYIVSRSANKREDHLQLVGTILPIDHPFWNIHTPPNGWGCKCSIRPTDEQPTDVPDSVEVPPEFAINPGKDGKVFNVEEHPYAQLPQAEYKKVLHEARGAFYHYEKQEQEKQWMNTVAGKLKVKVNRLQNPVEFNHNSFDKNMRLDKGFWDRLNLLNNIKEVLQDAEYLHEEPPKKPKQQVAKYHILRLTKNDKVVIIYIEERKTGTLYLYSLHTKK